jgi:hypothetical protein
MSKVLIIVNAKVKEAGRVTAISPVTEKMVSAIKQAIAADSPSIAVEVLATASLWSDTAKFKTRHQDYIYCPLTIQLPDWLEFPAKEIYQRCQNVERTRQWVERHLGYKTSMGDSCLGDLWLPVVLTAKKTFYAEVIGEGAFPNSYQQPIEVSDTVRQSLYHLAHQLLYSLSAPASVYLLQFRLLGQEIVFDRLWPFPAAPALASLRSQQPDLFSSYWKCLSGKSIQGLRTIPAFPTY